MSVVLSFRLHGLLHFETIEANIASYLNCRLDGKELETNTCLGTVSFIAVYL